MQRGREMSAVIIAPHSHCEDFTIRDCDRRAKQAADILYEILQSKGINVTRINHEVLRSDSDLNRLPARHSVTRRALWQAISANQPTYLLELHSFPRDDFGGSKITILNLPENTKAARQLAEGIDEIRLSTGSYANDIQYQYLDWPGVIPFLIEVNEDRQKMTDAELVVLMHKIANRLFPIRGGGQTAIFYASILVCVCLLILVIYVGIDNLKQASQNIQT